HHAVALDRDRPVALLLDELPEEIVSQVEQNVLAVGGLTQGEQPWPGREQPHDGSSVDGMGGVFDASSHALNGIVEPTIKTSPRYWQDSEAKPSKRRTAQAGRPGTRTRPVHAGDQKLRGGRHPSGRRTHPAR